MNKPLENKISMYHKVVTFFDHHLPTLSPLLPALPTQVAELGTLIHALEQDIMVANQNRKGFTIQKNSYRDTVHEMTMSIAQALYAIAGIDNNDALMRKVKMQPSQLKAMSDIDKLYWCEQLAETAAQHSAQLASIGVDTAMLVAYDAALAAYKGALQDMSQQRNAKSIAMGNIQKLVNDISAKLKIIDAMMGVLPNTQQQLHTHYLSNRRIDNF